MQKARDAESIIGTPISEWTGTNRCQRSYDIADRLSANVTDNGDLIIRRIRTPNGGKRHERHDNLGHVEITRASDGEARPYGIGVT